MYRAVYALHCALQATPFATAGLESYIYRDGDAAVTLQAASVFLRLHPIWSSKSINACIVMSTSTYAGG